MRAVLQRVRSARVTVEGPSTSLRTGPSTSLRTGEETGAIGPGLLVYLGITHDDTIEEARWLARKLAELRVFEAEPGAAGGFERSLLDVGGAALVVSQFTLYAGTRRGRRPSFTDAAPPEVAAPLVEEVIAELAALGVPVARGRFGAHMLVESTNDGPVTITLDTRDRASA